jgi:hypothetical protein
LRQQDLPVSAVPKDYEDVLLTTPCLRREQRTIEAMLHIWCEAHPLHVRSHSGEFCAGCEGLFNYASYRLFKCPYGEEKPTCKKCPIHCYTRDKREQMHEVMRFAGPRMLLRHPILAIRHLLDEKKEPPPLMQCGGRSCSITRRRSFPPDRIIPPCRSSRPGKPVQ